jgi:photosystem II stability/assembly factor-like uncharacterized protein
MLPAQWTNLGTQSIPLQMTSDYHGIRISHHPPEVPNTGPLWKMRHTDDDWVTEQVGHIGGSVLPGCCAVEAIRFVNDSVGFVQYINFGIKHIARTTDRGITLNDLQPGGGFALMPSNHADLWPLDDTTVYVVGEHVSLTGTRAYRITPTRSDTIFLDSTLIGEGSKILFLDAQIGFVIASDHAGVCRLYRTTNGGLSWSQRLAVGVGPLRGIDFVSDSIGFVGGESGVFYKTTDAGQTWNSLAINGPVNVYALDFATEQIGFLGAAGGMVLRTIDGGNFWTSDILDSNITVTYVKAINTTMAYALGDDSTLYKRDYIAGANAGVSPLNEISIYPNPTQGAVHIVMPATLLLRQWQLRDLRGQVMDAGTGLDVDMQDLPSGLYILEVTSSKGLQRIRLVRS